jgi:hypothetical protein
LCIVTSHHELNSREKWSNERTGIKFSDEINKKKGRLGELNPFYNKKHSPKTLAIIGAKSLINSSGEKNGMYAKGYLLRGNKNGGWFGGISDNKYGPEFNRTLRTKIRKRDNYTCAICYKKGLDVHHIDYDKKNNLDKNLITLYHKDHMKTNFNRIYWMIFLKKYINEKIK